MSYVKNIIDLKNYVSPNTETSLYKGIPVEFLNTVIKIMSRYGVSYKIRYRGPRKNDGRDKFNQQSTCLKSNAVSFTVYPN